MTVALRSWCSKVFGRRTGSYTVTPAPRHAGDVSGRAVAHHWCHSSSDAPASPAAAVQKLPCVLSYLDAKGDFDRCTSSTGKCGYYDAVWRVVDNVWMKTRLSTISSEGLPRLTSRLPCDEKTTHRIVR